MSAPIVVEQAMKAVVITRFGGPDVLETHDIRARSLQEKISITAVFAEEVVPLLANESIQPVIDSVFPLRKSRMLIDASSPTRLSARLYSRCHKFDITNTENLDST